MNQLTLKGYAYNKQNKTTSTGKTITNFAVKVNNGKDKEGKYTQEYFNCRYWGEHDLQGLLIFEGRLAFDTWDKEGQKQVRPYMIVSEIKGDSKQQSDDFPM